MLARQGWRKSGSVTWKRWRKRYLGCSENLITGIAMVEKVMENGIGGFLDGRS